MTTTRVNNAVKIALFLKSLDGNLRDAVVQADTNPTHAVANSHERADARSEGRHDVSHSR